MSVIVNGTEIENVNVVDKDGNVVALSMIRTSDGVVVFSKEYLVYTGVDVNGVHEGTLEYDGTPVEYVIGKPMVTFYKFVLDEVAPTAQDEYLNKYYLDTTTNTYVAITSSNIETLITNGTIVVGETIPYSSIETKDMNEAQTQNYTSSGAKGSGLIDGYIGHVVIDKYTHNGLPVSNIMTYALDKADNYATRLKILRDFDTWKQYSLYAKNSIYINSKNIIGPTSTTPIIYGGLDNCDVIIGKDVEKMYAFIGGTVTCNLYFEDGFKATELGFDTGNSADTIFSGTTFLNEVVIPSTITYIHGVFDSCDFQGGLVIPASVTYIDSYAIDFTSGNTLKFLHSATDEITFADLPFGNIKTAKEVVVYTDNQTIHDRFANSDSFTATFYHLDGTPW